MTVLNCNYINSVEFKKFITENNIIDSSHNLIQIFYSHSDEELILEAESLLKEMFTKSAIIGTSTAGIIDNSLIVDNTILISFSLFEEAVVVSKGYKNDSFDSILEDLSQELITNETKLLLIFANTFTLDSTNLLKCMHAKFPHIVIAGGNSADDYKFEKCYLYSKNLSDCDIVFASISSENLEVKTDYLFNWQTIGEAMIVTQSKGSTVYTIDNKSAIGVYEEYLGKEVSSNLLLYGIEFPLIYEQDGNQIARALVGCDYENGSITFAGEVPQNAEVRFGFANVDAIKDKNQQNLLNEYQVKQEAIYIYTCGSRRQTLGTFLNQEISMFKNFGYTTGFITYGEFFYNQKTCNNDLLNITTTFVSLNEKKSSVAIEFTKEFIEHSIKDVRLTALTNLVQKTSEKLDESNYYLKQFRNAVDESSIYSTTNALGVIIDANKNFELISGYSKEELIGKNHNVVRHPDTPKEVFSTLWKTIKAGKTWHGLVKNKRKDGSAYYVLSDVSPVYYRNGEFREYIGIRHDVSELEEYKILLKHELDTTSKNLSDNLNYTRQYEKAVNTSVAIIKTDTNNIITYANRKFLELTEYEEDEIIGMNCESIRDEHHKSNEESEHISEKLTNGEIVEATLYNKSKYGKIFITKSIFYPIVNTQGEIIEYIQVLNDITDIIELNEEIQSTQKEVVSTMGAIGETRSKETGLHVKRVAAYSYLLAILYGLDENDANLLKQASPMHDIGKVGIPDNILNKPGKLTPEEFEIMKSHAQLGYEMLKHSKRPILKASAIVAKEHHEKWDGSGYPNGLKAEEIHIFGRITAIADVFDALGHDRIYKKAWKLDDILNLFKEEQGKHFDPNLVDIFFNHLDKFLEIKNRLED